MAGGILTLGGFAVGLTVTLAASELLARGLTAAGSRLGFSEGLIGLLAALGADSPELSSAVIAILAGAGQVGVGVVVGSNLFNLAALLGLSAIVVGGVRVRRGPLAVDGGVGLVVMLATTAMVAELASPGAVALIVLPVSAAYTVALAASPRLAEPPEATTQHSWTPVLLLPIALVGVVGGSFAMVHAALAAAPALHISDAVLGTIVLAALTSLPNLWVALHFARRDRGTALFSAAMNSNTINLVGGLIIPALLVGVGISRGSLADFAWLLDLTLLAVLAPLLRRRLTRVTGGAIIGLYLVFVVLRIAGV